MLGSLQVAYTPALVHQGIGQPWVLCIRGTQQQGHLVGKWQQVARHLWYRAFPLVVLRRNMAYPPVVQLYYVAPLCQVLL